eukprot:TRINITY_DN5325_c0_g1_i6.p3 TRINITY_DN5325_c0_g1~~TRINITY_DN5325_c0_g1_i6.p3  ORF type:complete len:141 (+),score=19.14 TRINITY_DN5325_c0_g1_i6:229-651(+)
MAVMNVRCALAAAVLAVAAGTALPGYKTTYTVTQAAPVGTERVRVGDTVTVHATGIVKETGKQFWSTKDANKPFTYQAGVGRVITGWDQGCLGAAVGESRRLDIPAGEGYGANGFPAWGIPPNGGLVFEIEVLSIQHKDL